MSPSRIAVVEPATGQVAPTRIWQSPEPTPLAAVTCLVARTVERPLSSAAFEPLASTPAAPGLWRVRLDTPWFGGVTTIVVKMVARDDPEPSLLTFLMERGRLAPRLLRSVPLGDGEHLVIFLEDMGSHPLPVTWPRQPRLADAIVEWISRIARTTIPDPVPDCWTDWSRPATLVEQFEAAWSAIVIAQSVAPGWMRSDDLDLLRTVFGRRAILAQRLLPVSRRLIHGAVRPGNLRLIGEETVQVRAVNWSRGGRGPLAFDLYDLTWGLPEAEFESVLESLVCLMPFDVRPELTRPVLRLAGIAKAFLYAADALSDELRAPGGDCEGERLRRAQLATALTRLRSWHGQIPTGTHP